MLIEMILNTWSLYIIYICIVQINIKYNLCKQRDWPIARQSHSPLIPQYRRLGKHPRHGLSSPQNNCFQFGWFFVNIKLACFTVNIYIYIHIIMYSNITGKHLDLPALVGGHLRMCWKRGKNESFCLHHCQLHVVYRHAQHRDLCESLTHHHHHQTLIEDLQWMWKFNGGGRIKPLLKIFNECRSLTGVGELNPYWRSSMNVEV